MTSEMNRLLRTNSDFDRALRSLSKRVNIYYMTQAGSGGRPPSWSFTDCGAVESCIFFSDQCLPRKRYRVVLRLHGFADLDQKPGARPAWKRGKAGPDTGRADRSSGAMVSSPVPRHGGGGGRRVPASKTSRWSGPTAAVMEGIRRGGDSGTGGSPEQEAQVLDSAACQDSEIE